MAHPPAGPPLGPHRFSRFDTYPPEGPSPRPAVTFAHAFSNFFSYLFNFNGRASRSEFWWPAGPALGLLAVAFVAEFGLYQRILDLPDKGLSANSAHLPMVVLYLLLMAVTYLLFPLFFAALTARRLREANIPVWLTLLLALSTLGGISQLVGVFFDNPWLLVLAFPLEVLPALPLCILGSAPRSEPAPYVLAPPPPLKGAEAWRGFLTRIFVARGVSRRSEYWWIFTTWLVFTVPISALIIIVPGTITEPYGQPGSSPYYGLEVVAAIFAGAVVGLAVFFLSFALGMIFTICLQIRRLRDAGLSPAWLFCYLGMVGGFIFLPLALLPFVPIILSIYPSRPYPYNSQLGPAVGQQGQVPLHQGPYPGGRQAFPPPPQPSASYR